jgi:hypothetical protein
MVLDYERYGFEPSDWDIDQACRMPHDDLVDTVAVTSDDVARWENEGGRHLTSVA